MTIKAPFFSFLVAVILCIYVVAADYVGAVAEHTVFMGKDTDSSAYKLNVNLDIYANLTALASTRKVQILVFPEFGLVPANADSRESLYPYAEVIPAVNPSSPAIPCTDATFSDKVIMQRMSCAARDNRVALLVNTVDYVSCEAATDSNCPSDNHYQYNTNVVFDETGRFVAKYYKSHEFPGLRKAYDQVPAPSEVVFQSSWGIKYGIFTCYDIMFTDPAKELRKQGIEHFLYPVEQGQIGEDTIIAHWSKSEDAVLLSSNLGSGKKDCSGLLKQGKPLPAEKIHLTGEFADDNILVAVVPAATH